MYSLSDLTLDVGGEGRGGEDKGGEGWKVRSKTDLYDTFFKNLYFNSKVAVFFYQTLKNSVPYQNTLHYFCCNLIDVLFNTSNQSFICFNQMQKSYSLINPDG